LPSVASETTFAAFAAPCVADALVFAEAALDTDLT
jgi:hypothetical protein